MPVVDDVVVATVVIVVVFVTVAGLGVSKNEVMDVVFVVLFEVTNVVVVPIGPNVFSTTYSW